MWYPNYSDNDFNNILNKYEFKEGEKRDYVYQEPRQLLLRNWLSKNTIYDNMLLFHETGTGKCHGKNTPILMFDGTVKMVQNIKVTDVLMGDDSTERTVFSTTTGKDLLYNVRDIESNTKYTVNKEHILCLKADNFPIIERKSGFNKNRFIVQWIEYCKIVSKTFYYVKEDEDEEFKKVMGFMKGINSEDILEIAVKDYVKLPNSTKQNLKGYRVPVEFVEIDTFNTYVLGAWLSNSKNTKDVLKCNGYVSKYILNNTDIEDFITLEEDKEDKEDKEDYDNSDIENDNNLSINSTKFKKVLDKYNLLNDSDSVLRLPKELKCNSREKRLLFLAGILDNNGEYNENDTEYIFKSKHKYLIKDIGFICKSLGFDYRIEKSGILCKKSYNIVIYEGAFIDIPMLVPFKKSYKNKGKDGTFKMKVKKIGRGDYYGFTIDDNCRYLLGDFTVTHNTAAAITIAEGFKEYISNMGKKIVVLVKNYNIEKNFRNEMLTHCTGDEYIDDQTRERLRDKRVNSNLVERKEIKNRINRRINKQYDFMTYGTFVNQVLGMKEFEKDDIGRNTTKQKRDNTGGGVRKRPANGLKNFNNTLIIIDEAHNITNNDVYVSLKKVLEKSYNYRLLLLTATPMYDNPKEILEISNLMNAKRLQLPIRNERGVFNGNNPLMKKEESQSDNKLIKGGTIKITEYGKERLKETLLGKVSYLKANTDTFPKKIDMGESLNKNVIGSTKLVFCEMSEFQYNVYMNSLKIDRSIPFNNTDFSSTLQNIESEENLNNNLNSKTNSLYKNSSDASTFVFKNGLYGKDGFESAFSKELKLKKEFSETFNEELENNSKKLFILLENVNKSPGNIFIYSNYVNYGGTKLIKQLLLSNGYTMYKSGNNDYKSFILFDDSINIEKRETQKAIFNSSENKDGKLIKIIIGSPIISEGITLKNIRQVHILEPTWNMSRINQIIGRALRHYSHADLPLTHRTVEIYKYCSIYKNKSSCIDKEKYILSEEKDRSNKVIERLLKTLAFDCVYNANANANESKGIEGTPECDYTVCDYACEIPSKEGEVDKHTYNLYIEFFEKYDIEFTMNFIKKLFKTYFIWNIDDILVDIKSNTRDIISNETINYVLDNLVNEKTIINDMYNRDGYIIKKGEFYIFNPIDIDINTSIYSKMLDFEVNTNKYDLNEYSVNVGFDKVLNKESQSVKKKVKEISLSEDDKEYNQSIIELYSIFGTYRARRKKNEEYGKKDNKLRIIDNRMNNSDNISESSGESKEDERKNITGMEVKSFTKNQLFDIITVLKIKKDEIREYLKIPKGFLLNNLGKEQYISIITQHLTKNKMILK